MEDTPFVGRLRAALDADDLAPGTVQRTLIDATQFEVWLAGTTGQGIDPDNVQVASIDLQEWRGWLQRQNLSPGTVQRKFASLRKAFMLLSPEVALELRWPKLPQQQATAPSGFSRTERNAILRAVDRLSPRDAAIVATLLHVACRAGSLVNLRIDDLVIGERSGQATFRHAKNDRTYVCPLNSEARAYLRRWLEVRPPVSHGHVFCSERFPHGPISRQVVWEVWHQRLRALLPKAVADKIRGPHQARHDVARRLLSGDEGQYAPAPASDVAAILGHADPRICVAIYSKPSAESMRRAVGRLAGDDEGDE